MADSITITGTVIKLEDPQAFGAKGFRKAVCVVETQAEKFPQKIPVEASGKKADLFTEANICEGDTVTISANLQGREWQGKYFLSLGAWKVQLESEGSKARPTAERREPAPRQPIPDAPSADDSGDDPCPF